MGSSKTVLANSFQYYLRFVQLNNAILTNWPYRLDCHNNTPFQNQLYEIKRYSISEQKAFFNIKTPTTGSLQIWLRDDSCWTTVSFDEDPVFRSTQAIVSFGIKLADPETFNKFWHHSFCSWAEFYISTQEKVVDFVKTNLRSDSGTKSSKPSCLIWCASQTKGPRSHPNVRCTLLRSGTHLSSFALQSVYRQTTNA